jgi:hypothetical protein
LRCSKIFVICEIICLFVCEDYELWLRLCLKNKVKLIQEPIVIKYGGHLDQLSTKFFAMDYFRVKAMVNLALRYDLSHNHFSELLKVARSKAEILLKGYLSWNGFVSIVEVLYL